MLLFSLPQRERIKGRRDGGLASIVLIIITVVVIIIIIIAIIH